MYITICQPCYEDDCANCLQGPCDCQNCPCCVTQAPSGIRRGNGGGHGDSAPSYEVNRFGNMQRRRGGGS